jgi:hypothetical protein
MVCRRAHERGRRSAYRHHAAGGVHPLDERAREGYRSRMAEDPVPRADPGQTKRDIRAAIIFGVVAATIEMAVLLYFVFG